jgi:hypothetical protein
MVSSTLLNLNLTTLPPYTTFLITLIALEKRHVHTPILASVVIFPVLRDLVERHLYHHINVDGYKATVIWPLYRTMVSRPDLTNKVSIFECVAYYKEDVYYAWLYSANVELHEGYIGPVDVNPTFIEMFAAKAS